MYLSCSLPKPYDMQHKVVHCYHMARNMSEQNKRVTNRGFTVNIPQHNNGTLSCQSKIHLQPGFHACWEDPWAGSEWMAERGSSHEALHSPGTSLVTANFQQGWERKHLALEGTCALGEDYLRSVLQGLNTWNGNNRWQSNKQRTVISSFIISGCEQWVL